jgi:hypothetical protein
MMLLCISLNCNSQVNGDSLMRTSSHSHTCTHACPQTHASIISIANLSMCAHMHTPMHHTHTLARSLPTSPPSHSLAHTRTALMCQVSALPYHRHANTNMSVSIHTPSHTCRQRMDILVARETWDASVLVLRASLWCTSALLHVSVHAYTHTQG